MREVRRALGCRSIDPATLTPAERLQHKGWKRRAEADAALVALHAQGVATKETVRQTGWSGKLVRDVGRCGCSEFFYPRASSLGSWLDRLNAEWHGGCRNGTELWRRLHAAGFPGSLRALTVWATRRR